MLIGSRLMYTWLPAGWIQELRSEVVRKKSSFSHTIPFSKSYVDDIIKLTERDATTWTQKENFVNSLERYRIGLLNNQQLQDE